MVRCSMHHQESAKLNIKKPLETDFKATYYSPCWLLNTMKRYHPLCCLVSPVMCECNSESVHTVKCMSMFQFQCWLAYNYIYAKCLRCFIHACTEVSTRLYVHDSTDMHLLGLQTYLVVCDSFCYWTCRHTLYYKTSPPHPLISGEWAGTLDYWYGVKMGASIEPLISQALFRGLQPQ